MPLHLYPKKQKKGHQGKYREKKVQGQQFSFKNMVKEFFHERLPQGFSYIYAPPAVNMNFLVRYGRKSKSMLE